MVIRVYLLLLAMLVGLMGYSRPCFGRRSENVWDPPASKMFDLAGDALETVLGAIVGGLSVAGKHGSSGHRRNTTKRSHAQRRLDDGLED